MNIFEIMDQKYFQWLGNTKFKKFISKEKRKGGRVPVVGYKKNIFEINLGYAYY